MKINKMEFNIEPMSEEIQTKINDNFYKYQMETTGILEYTIVAFSSS